MSANVYCWDDKTLLEMGAAGFSVSSNDIYRKGNRLTGTIPNSYFGCIIEVTEALPESSIFSGVIIRPGKDPNSGHKGAFPESGDKYIKGYWRKL